MEVLVRGWRALAWWVKGVVGEDAYERYLDHHRRSGHTGEPMSARAFWRARTVHAERNPQNRCC